MKNVSYIPRLVHKKDHSSQPKVARGRRCFGASWREQLGKAKQIVPGDPSSCTPMERETALNLLVVYGGAMKISKMSPVEEDVLAEMREFFRKNPHFCYLALVEKFRRVKRQIDECGTLVPREVYCRVPEVKVLRATIIAFMCFATTDDCRELWRMKNELPDYMTGQFDSWGMPQAPTLSVRFVLVDENNNSA